MSDDVGDEEEDPIETVRLDDWDRGSRVHVFTRRLHVVLAAMPPSWWNGKDPLEDFQDLLAKATGLQVEGADKEMFVVRGSTPATVEVVRAFLADLKKSYPRV